MRAHLFRLTVFLLISLTLPLTATAQVVDIPDLNLRTAIEEALGKASGDTITAVDMANLTTLEVSYVDISDLTGLAGAIKLRSLYLDDNNISDISAVAGLTNLTRLEFGSNNISDQMLSPLAYPPNATNLRFEVTDTDGLHLHLLPIRSHLRLT